MSAAWKRSALPSRAAMMLLGLSKSHSLIPLRREATARARCRCRSLRPARRPAQPRGAWPGRDGCGRDDRRAPTRSSGGARCTCAVMLGARRQDVHLLGSFVQFRLATWFPPHPGFAEHTELGVPPRRDDQGLLQPGSSAQPRTNRDHEVEYPAAGRDLRDSAPPPSCSDPATTRGGTPRPRAAGTGMSVYLGAGGLAFPHRGFAVAALSSSGRRSAPVFRVAARAEPRRRELQRRGIFPGARGDCRAAPGPRARDVTMTEASATRRHFAGE